MNATIPPVHPGEILLEEFMQPLGLSQSALAIALRIPNQRVHDLVHGRRGITLDTAARLARLFETSTAFWLNLQTRYELEVATDEGCSSALPRTSAPLTVRARPEDSGAPHCTAWS